MLLVRGVRLPLDTPRPEAEAAGRAKASSPTRHPSAINTPKAAAPRLRQELMRRLNSRLVTGCEDREGRLVGPAAGDGRETSGPPTDGTSCIFLVFGSRPVEGLDPCFSR